MGQNTVHVLLHLDQTLALHPFFQKHAASSIHWEGSKKRPCVRFLASHYFSRWVNYPFPPPCMTEITKLKLYKGKEEKKNEIAND